ncbi:hypothetical protein M758_9G125700 [Ceratodon purpureus]|nr:hypothetical protein M758_9G125700 [Ceratodon purpureus]
MGSNEDGKASSQHIQEKIVIVGGGIGGLACALALHRVGLKSVVLEQSDTLRATGNCITLWSNALRVLDALGIGEQFRTLYHNILEYEIFNQQGKRLAGLVLAECDGPKPHELRAVERRFLLEALAGQLPPGTIRFKSRVTSIEKSETSTGITDIHLQDGSIYNAQVVLGFDGQKSVVAEWMGLKKAELVGQVGIRGMAIFPNGHKFEDKVYYTVGKGTRSAIAAVNDTKIYWFILWNDWGEGYRNTSPEQLKAEALERSKAYQSRDIELCINNTPLEHFIKSTIRHRINTMDPTTQVVGTVTLAGDASHPTTPNMGQGGCMALEDAILLTKKLYPVLTEGPNTDSPVAESERIHLALVEFQQERHDRTYSLSVQSHKVGVVMQSAWSVICFYRDWYLIPKSLNPKYFLNHTLFDVGKLPIQLS